VSLIQYRPLTLSLQERLPLGEANITPEGEGTSSATPLCVQVSPVSHRRVSHALLTGSPVGVNDLKWWASTEGGSPSLEVHGEPVRVIVKLESTLQKYTDSSNPKAVMVRKKNIKPSNEGRGFYPNFRW